MNEYDEQYDHAFAQEAEPVEADLFGEEAVEAEPAESLAYATPSSYVGGLKRRGKLLITPRTATLPFVCVKTGRTAEEAEATGEPLARIDKTYTWYPALILLTLFLPFGIIILLVLYFTLRKTAGVSFSVRRQFVRKRRRVVWLSILGIVLSFVGFGLAIYVGQLSRDPMAPMTISVVSSLVLIGSAVWASVGARLLYPKRITETEARFRGAGEPFLDQIPEVQGV